MKRLAIIPARGGSKRIPHKNVKDFCGMPMVCHALNIARTSGLFDCIHVSTDDDNIKQIATEFGFAPSFDRPKELSDDHSTMMEVLRYVIEQYEILNEVFETVVLLYTTSPLTDPDDLIAAVTQFEASDKEKSYLAVTPYPAPIEHAFRMGEACDLEPYNVTALAVRTQDLAHAYYDAGMFAVYSACQIKNSIEAGDFLKFRGYEVPSHRVTDIDWPEDWDRAEALYHALNVSRAYR